ncbi:MAG: hypothetical protein M5U26_00980 [Planctomycetota bacterium]|nr:hypothetical protein [Planctomycetota bacterium]
MKFYFCEKCGKRLTEQEIAAGAAKDKKLRGVFCADCAVGVMTMETVPLTEDSARELLGQQQPPEAPQRKSDAIKLPPGVRPARASERSIAARPAARGGPAAAHAGAKPGSHALLLLGVGAAVVVLGLALLLSGGSPQPQARPKPERMPSAVAAPVRPSPALPAPVQAPKDPTPAEPPVEAPPPDPAPAEVQPTPEAHAPAEPVLPVEPAPPQRDPPPSDPPAPAPAEPSQPVQPVQPAEPAPKAWLAEAKVLELAAGSTPLAEVLSIFEAESLHELPAADSRATILALTRMAHALESDISKALLAKTGERVVVTNAKGQRRFVTVSQPRPGMLHVDLGAGPQPLDLGDLALSSIRELAGGTDDLNGKLAAYHALRGDPAQAAKQLEALPEALRAPAGALVEQRRAAWLEAQARADLAEFEKLLEARQTAAAKSLAEKIVARFAGTEAVRSFKPPMDERLAELDSQGLSIRGSSAATPGASPTGGSS